MRIIIIELIAFAVVPYFYLYSQWSKNPNENLQVAVHGGNIHAVPDRKGGAIITFNNFDYDVVTTYLQAINKYGYLKWTEPKIIADGPSPQNIGVGLFSSNDDNYIFGYNSGYTIDSNFIIYAFFHPYVQKIDTNGNKLWGEYGIELNPNSPSQRVDMFMCNDGNGGIYAFWKISPPSDYSTYDSLFVQHITKDGEKLWGDNGIFIGDSIVDVNNSWVADDDSGGIYVQYYKRAYEYYIQKFDTPGNLKWTLSTPNNFSKSIKDGYGGIIISGVVDSYPTNKLIINRISSEGGKLWGEGITVDDSVGNSLPPLIFLNTNNTVSVFWDNRWWPIDDVYLQRYTLDSEQVWFEPLKVSDFISAKSRLGMLASNNNSNLVVWSENRDTVGRNYTQKIDSMGNKLWVEDKVLGSGTASFNLITDGNGGAIAIWQKDPPWGGIYAQQISKNGNLGEVITSVKEDDNVKPVNFYLEQNFPNPFNPSTTIKFSLPESGNIKLEIFNILGEKVQTLLNEFYNAGIYTAEFNAVNLPSGIYFYQLQVGSFVETKKMVLLK